jgi:LmbE family N-acetylglucosaminyl deacetylase
MPPRLLRVLFILSLVFCVSFGSRAETPTPQAILQDLRSFREMGSVLYVAAHPDDENTLLIAYLARGRNYRTAYLSVTRGDGGQNVLGPELDSKLGVARTQELLAARRLDGGRQFFTRAIDFGFSKDYRETLSIWDEKALVADTVRVIRTFRPDVIVTRFAPWPTGTHGHHTASAVLALEAFKVAGDPKAFPDQLKDLAPWQPKRILMNGRGGPGTNSEAVHMEITGNDPVLDISFSDLAGRSRSMHKTQGFGNFTGGGGGGGSRSETFQLLAGEPATNDIMDGIDTTWNRVPGGAEIGKTADEIIAQFDAAHPSASVPALLQLHAKLAALKSSDPMVAEKRTQLDRILQHCLGLEIATVIPHSEVVPGETLEMRHTVTEHASTPVRWIGVRYPAAKHEIRKAIDLHPNEIATRESSQVLPPGTPVSQPYWLREEGTAGTFHVDDPSLIGRPENPPAFPVEHVFQVGGETIVVADEPVQLLTGSGSDQPSRRLEVIPPVSLSVDSDVALFTPGSSHAIEIEIIAARAKVSGTARLEAPAGWNVEPAGQPFRIGAIGDRARARFQVTAPSSVTTGRIVASAEVKGVRYRNERAEINYRHIPRQLLQPVAAIKAVSLDLAIRGKKIGYLAGAGDSIADNLKQMGCSVSMLDDTNMTTNGLAGFDAVVVGVRAFNVRNNIGAQLPALFDYVARGGTVVAQYNRPNGLKSEELAPYSLHLSDQRVTDETAAMEFLAPEHPVLNTPNKITSADFSGWVQERGIYFPNEWDGHFTPIFACHDPGEKPMKGSLLVAQYGKGYFVYTGLDFFRELPAGVPGAYRLFANLVSLGK